MENNQQRVNRRRRNLPAELKVEIVDCLPLENAVHFLANVPNRLIIRHCAPRVRRMVERRRLSRMPYKWLYDLSNEAEHKAWLDNWLDFMDRIGKPVRRLPIVAKQVLNLVQLYKLVVQLGGLVEVIQKKLWREVIKGLNPPPYKAYYFRVAYIRYLYDYECHQHGFSTMADLRVAMERKRAPVSGGADTGGSSASVD